MTSLRNGSSKPLTFGTFDASWLREFFRTADPWRSTQDFLQPGSAPALSGRRAPYYPLRHRAGDAYVCAVPPGDALHGKSCLVAQNSHCGGKYRPE